MENHLSYDGKVSKLFLIWIKNLFFGILTLSIYRAWGKTNYRRYCYRSFTIDGDRPEYSGTGGELWIGMIKANIIIVFLFMLFYIPLIIFMGDDPKPNGMPGHVQLYSNLLIIPAIWVLMYLAHFSALRYRLTRTKWRGIRGSMHGKIWPYVGFRIKRFFINLITLGFTIGRTDILDNNILLNQAYIGDTKFEYKANPKCLDRINLITLLLAIPTLFMSRSWYKAAKLNAKYNNLSIGNIKFSSNFGGWELMLFSLGNMLILIFTLLIGIPFVIHRIMRHFNAHLQISGVIDEFKQGEDFISSNFGEGLTDHFNSDGIDLDFGLI